MHLNAYNWRKNTTIYYVLLNAQNYKLFILLKLIHILTFKVNVKEMFPSRTSNLINKFMEFALFCLSVENNVNFVL